MFLSVNEQGGSTMRNTGAMRSKRAPGRRVYHRNRSRTMRNTARATTAAARVSHGEALGRTRKCERQRVDRLRDRPRRYEQSKDADRNVQRVDDLAQEVVAEALRRSASAIQLVHAALWPARVDAAR